MPCFYSNTASNILIVKSGNIKYHCVHPNYMNQRTIKNQSDRQLKMGCLFHHSCPSFLRNRQPFKKKKSLCICFRGAVNIFF